MKKILYTYKSWIIALSILMIQCGIPSNELYNDLNTPKGLTYVSRTASGITVTFMAYNPETTFTGFNIYMSSSSESDVRSQKAQHVANGELNSTVETNYIVKNTTSLGYPTLQDSDSGVSTSRSTPTAITYIITFGPNSSSLSGAYWIGVTAWSNTNFLESGLSEIIYVP